MRKKLIFSSILVTIIFLVAITIDKNVSQVLSLESIRLSVFEKYLPSTTKEQRESTFDDLKKLSDQKEGTFAFFVRDLSNGETYLYNETENFYAASLYKTPIASAILKDIQSGNLTFSEKIKYNSYDQSSGTGIIITYPIGTEFTMDEVLNFLIKNSDNTAQNMLKRQISEQKLKQAFDLSGSRGFFIDNSTTVYDQGIFYVNLMRESYLNKDSKKYLLEIMTETNYEDRITLGLKDNLRFAHKIGNWGDTGSWHDCGYVYNNYKKVVVCVMSRYTDWVSVQEVSTKLGQFVSMFFN